MWSELDGQSTTVALSLVGGAITVWHKAGLNAKENMVQVESCVFKKKFLSPPPWSVGEEPFSFGYGGTGKKSENCKFADFGERFGENDVIGCYIVSNCSFNFAIIVLG